MMINPESLLLRIAGGATHELGSHCEIGLQPRRRVMSSSFVRFSVYIEMHLKCNVRYTSLSGVGGWETH